MCSDVSVISGVDFDVDLAFIHDVYGCHVPLKIFRLPTWPLSIKTIKLVQTLILSYRKYNDEIIRRIL